MANVNKVILVGRLTREPELRTFSNGGKVAAFGFAVNSRRKNPQTGQWEDGDPMFIDCKAFNRGETGHLADTVGQYLHKGHRAYLEGRLDLEQWDDKATGAKRSKHVLVVENVQFLEPRADGGEGGNYDRPARTGPAPQRPAAYPTDDRGGDQGGGGSHSEIPF
ncbi:MAG TPA: single-stranded DNA-binding protein [Gemmataceae bacterium]|nr:single-stranded DNA-binding protein [Gemmataceae bacterium]